MLASLLFTLLSALLSRYSFCHFTVQLTHALTDHSHFLCFIPLILLAVLSYSLKVQPRNIIHKGIASIMLLLSLLSLDHNLPHLLLFLHLLKWNLISQLLKLP